MKNIQPIFLIPLMLLVLLISQPVNAETQIAELLNRFQGLDLDQDGVAEIESITPIDLGDGSPAELKPTDKVVLVLVEDRLLNEIPDSEYTVEQLKTRLRQHQQDLAAEGYVPLVVQCSVYSGEQHQDGLTLLAIRRLLKELSKSCQLQGTVLVGSFPEASLVRRWIWKRERWNVTIADVAYKGDNQTDFLRIVPEAVAPRADVVLADLDGNWEAIYVKGPQKIDSIEAIPPTDLETWPVDGQVFTSTKFNDKQQSFEDFFWIQEDDFQRLESPEGTLRLKLNLAQQNPEVGEQERTRPNPMAVPDILVSRINARHIAVNPEPTYRDRHGNGFLDANGEPQIVETTKRITTKDFLKRDPGFERTLLVAYFDRNHQYRTGPSDSQQRTAAASYGRGLINAENLNQYLAKASDSFGPPVSFTNASLLDYVTFLTTPARLKGVSAHSSPWNSSFGKKYKTDELETLVGGHPWRWKEEKSGPIFQYTPSLSEQGGTADAYLYRSIYENKILADTGGSLFIHNGCEVNTPSGALRFPYNHPQYGSSNGFQNSESMLFFLNGVALASRAKVFYDKPRGFTDELGKDPKQSFGAGWRAYFEVESQDQELASNVAGNKRTYPWSIIGDWTLCPTPAAAPATRTSR